MKTRQKEKPSEDRSRGDAGSVLPKLDQQLSRCSLREGPLGARQGWQGSTKRE